VRERLRQWWNYPFAVAGPASVLFFVSIAGAGVAGLLLLSPPADALPGFLVLGAGWLGLAQARHRFMHRREIASIRLRDRRSQEIAGAIAGVVAAAIPIALHSSFAWAFPLFAAFGLAIEFDRRQTWTKRGRPGDPRWALDWSPEADPVYDLRAFVPLRAKNYPEARRLIEKGLERNLTGWRLTGALYNLSSIEALSGEREAAIEHLNAAVALNDDLIPARRLAQKDHDLDSIRDDPRFPAAESP
jgi:tetratricopeptide (TPR) repeat protein